MRSGSIQNYARPEKSEPGFPVRAAPEQTVALHPPATADYVPRAPICRLPPETICEPPMTDNIRYIRDYKRKEEREAADVRLAKQVMGSDTAPRYRRGPRHRT